MLVLVGVELWCSYLSMTSHVLGVTTFRELWSTSGRKEITRFISHVQMEMGLCTPSLRHSGCSSSSSGSFHSALWLVPRTYVSEDAE